MPAWQLIDGFRLSWQFFLQLMRIVKWCQPTRVWSRWNFAASYSPAPFDILENNQYFHSITIWFDYRFNSVTTNSQVPVFDLSINSMKVNCIGVDQVSIESSFISQANLTQAPLVIATGLPNK